MTLAEVTVVGGDHKGQEKMLKGRVPEQDPNIEGPCLVRDETTGAPVALVLQCSEALIGPLRRAMRDFPMSTTLRSSGMRNRSSVFGFTARNAVLRRVRRGAEHATRRRTPRWPTE